MIFQSLDAFIKTLEDLSSSNKSETEIYISYEDRESEEKKNLIIDFMNKIQNKCTILKIPFNEYREDFMCEDIHIFKITAKQSSWNEEINIFKYYECQSFNFLFE